MDGKDSAVQEETTTMLRLQQHRENTRRAEGRLGSCLLHSVLAVGRCG